MQLGLMGTTTALTAPRFRIKLVTTGLEYGGAEAQVVQLAQGFKERGHAVSVVSLIPLTGYAEQLRQAGIPLGSLEMPKGIPDPRAAIRLASQIRRFQQDVVHAQMIHANLVSRLSRLLAPGPVYLSTAQNTYEYAVKGDQPSARKGGWRDLAYRFTDRLADLTTNVSQVGVERYVADRLSSRSKTIFVPNGIDLRRFCGNPGRAARLRQELNPEAGFVWLAAGRLEAQKDYPNLLRAFKQVTLRQPSARLWIAGQGSLRQPLEHLGAELGLEHTVRFLGLRKDVGDLMCAADAFVMSSAWEGLPMVLLEAAKMGLPVVATDVGGNRDVVLAGKSGLLVPPNETEALCGAMLELMDMPPARRKAMGMVGQQYVTSTYSMDVVLDRWEILYAGLIRRRKIPWMAGAGS